MNVVLAVHNVVFAISHWLAANTALNPDNDLSKQVKNQIEGPILTGAEVLVPAAVAVSGIHKLMEHRESAGSLLVELITKGGGTVLVIELIKAMVK